MEIYQQFQPSGINYITCSLDQGVIYRIDTITGNRTPIGVDNTTMDESVALVDKYYNRLVELGDIVKPLTQEEINAELLTLVKALTDKVDTLEKEKTNNGYKANNSKVGNTKSNSGNSSQSKSTV